MSVGCWCIAFALYTIIIFTLNNSMFIIIVTSIKKNSCLCGKKLYFWRLASPYLVFLVFLQLYYVFCDLLLGLPLDSFIRLQNIISEIFEKNTLYPPREENLYFSLIVLNNLTGLSFKGHNLRLSNCCWLHIYYVASSSKSQQQKSEICGQILTVS